ncbi:MAG: hypothetical protein GF390_00865 [Candidatus Pacebacteria bacterium]|nr:hypothetical protein [Candidatus Paceibacterota bacterium]
MAKALNFSRQSFYYQSRLDKKDSVIRKQILNLYEADDTLGPKKPAPLLGVGHNRVARVMDKYGLHPRRAANECS